MSYYLSLCLIIPTLLHAISINEVVLKTLQTNPQIQTKQEVYLSEKELLGVAQSDYLPSIDLAYTLGSETTQTIANAREKVSVHRQDASVTLNQNLFTGFDTVHRVDAQKALILSASKQIKSTANFISLEAVSAYLTILKNNELHNIAQTNVDVHKKYLDQIKEKADAGVGRISDYKQTLSRFQNAKSIFFLTKRNYHNSLSSFKRITNIDVVAKDLIKPSLAPLPAQTIEELILIAIQNNPTIHVNQADIKFSEAVLNRSNAAFYPKVDFRAQNYWNKNLNGIEQPGDALVEENGYNLLFLLTYNIFNGLADTSNKEANRHKVLEQNNNLVDAKRFIIASTTIAWQTFQFTDKQLFHIDKNIEASAQTLANYQEENDLGRRSIVDLLNIELEYNAAKNRKVTAEYDRLLAYYEILSHTGKLLETMSAHAK